MKRTQHGFTIVEVIVVIAVIAILGAVAIVGYGAWRQKTVESQLKSDLQGAATAMENARNFGTGYPSSIPSTFIASEGTVLALAWVNMNDFCIQASSSLIDNAFYTGKDSKVLDGPCPSDPNGPPSEQIAKLLASDGGPMNYFGYSVSIYGDIAAIGAPYDDDLGTYSGSVYIYTRSGGTWTQQAKLKASDGAANSYFGYSVSVTDTTVLIGAYGSVGGVTFRGSAYVFTRSGGTWTQQAKLLASDGVSFDYFGASVALSGDTAVVGAPHLAGGRGSAYVFTRSGSTWTQQAKLMAADIISNDRFGSSVAMSESTVIIGAKPNTIAGSAYVFTRSGSTWTQQAKLMPGDGIVNNAFGGSVAVDGDTVIIGASQDDDKGANSGSSYIYTRSGSTWTQQEKLTSDDGEAGDNFGQAVGLSGNILVVSAYQDDDKGANSGSAYIYTRSGSTWTQQAKMTASDGSASDYFGYSVGLSGNSMIIGAYGDDDLGSVAGSAFIFGP